MDTDELEARINDICHGYRHGKDEQAALLGPIQATARVFVFQALAAWAIMEAAAETPKDAPDLGSWLRKIVEHELPYVLGISSITVELPKH